jgi:hypothetical protein
MTAQTRFDDPRWDDKQIGLDEYVPDQTDEDTEEDTDE